jgi:cytoskeleton protein RodZ
MVEPTDSGGGEVEVELQPKIGPGRALREAREGRNVTQEAVAKQLHIDITQVRALEEDDYGKFAAPIFVTGNLRAYARLLGMAPEPLIEAYQNLGTAAAPPLERVARLSQHPETVATVTQVPRWMAYFLAAAVVVAVILIWHTEASKLLAPIMDLSSLSETPTPDATRNTVAIPAPGMGETPQPSPGASAANGGGSVQDTLPLDEPRDQTQGPQATLVLKADKPSWVEVKDVSGKRVFYELMVPGDTQTVEGAPPFDVLLGYSPGVTLEYNGKQVDHSAYAHNDMAHFRVGDEGTERR